MNSVEMSSASFKTREHHKPRERALLLNITVN